MVITFILLENKNKPYKYKRDQNWTDITVFRPKTEYILRVD